MVSHVVLFSPREGLSSADRQRLASAFTAALQGIPGIRGVRVGARVRHGAGYEQSTREPAEYFVSIDFDDVAALQGYLVHPAHQALGQAFGESIGWAGVFDFEVGGVDAIRALV